MCGSRADILEGAKDTSHVTSPFNFHHCYSMLGVETTRLNYIKDRANDHTLFICITINRSSIFKQVSFFPFFFVGVGEAKTPSTPLPEPGLRRAFYELYCGALQSQELVTFSYDVLFVRLSCAVNMM